MDESFEVVTPALAAHARTLAGLAGELNAALAAGQVAVTGDAYGQTGARLAATLNGVARAGQEALRAGIDALEHASSTMRATATDYERQDSTSGDRFTGIGGARP